MKILRVLKDVMLGNCCINCKTPGPELCQACIDKFADIDFPFCIYCDELSIDGVTHKRCLKYCSIYKHTSSYVYTGAIRKLILNIKLNHRAFNSLDILFESKSFKENINLITKDIDVIVPFPKTPHYIELEKKSFVNLLTENISEGQSIPIVDLLYKTTSTKQKSRTKYTRENIRNELAYKKEAVQFIAGKRVLIIDDVTTTGSSLVVAAKLLKELGAHTINSYALAKDMRYN